MKSLYTTPAATLHYLRHVMATGFGKYKALYNLLKS